MRSQGASNSWAVHGNYTTTGKPVLCNDPHLEAGIPTSFHISELRYGDHFVVGASLPGVPLFASARSKHLSWGITSINSDISDIFEEKINGTKYQFKDEWRDLEFRDEVIKVKGGESINLTVRFTHHGPVMDHIDSFMHHIDNRSPYATPIGDFSFAWTCYRIESSALETFMNIHELDTVKEVIS